MLRAAVRALSGLFAFGLLLSPGIAPAANASTVAALTAFSVNPTQVVGGTSGASLSLLGTKTPAVNGSVTLSGVETTSLLSSLAATPQPQNVTLASSNPAVATVPASVSLYAGTTASFPVTTYAVAALTRVMLSATYGATTLSTSLVVLPPSVSSLTLSSASTVGGITQTGNSVCLNGPAPASGASINFSSSDVTVLPSPTGAVVPAGLRCTTFQIQPAAVWSPSPVSLTAALNDASAGASLTVVPPSVTSISGLPASMTDSGFQGVTVSACLNGPAPAGGTWMTLTSSSSSLGVAPVGSTDPYGYRYGVQAGQSCGFFDVGAANAVGSPQTATVTAAATVSPGTVSATTVVEPSTLQKVYLWTPYLATSFSVPAGGSVSALLAVELNGPTPDSGTPSVQLSQIGTGATSVTLPASATALSPGSIGTVPITIQPCSGGLTSCQDTITATYLGVSKTVTLTIVVTQ